MKYFKYMLDSHFFFIKESKGFVLGDIDKFASWMNFKRWLMYKVYYPIAWVKFIRSSHLYYVRWHSKNDNIE